MSKTYRPWSPNQEHLRPPCIQDSLPENLSAAELMQ